MRSVAGTTTHVPSAPAGPVRGVASVMRGSRRRSECPHTSRMRRALRRRPQHQEPRPQAEELPGPDDDADRRRTHELHLAQVDHNIGVIEARSPSHDLRQRGHGRHVVLAPQPHDSAIGVAAPERRHMWTRDGHGRDLDGSHGTLLASGTANCALPGSGAPLPSQPTLARHVRALYVSPLPYTRVAAPDSGIRGILHAVYTSARASQKNGEPSAAKPAATNETLPRSDRWPPIQRPDRSLRGEEHLDRRIHHSYCEHHLGRPLPTSRHSPTTVASLPWVVTPWETPARQSANAPLRCPYVA